MRQTNFRLIGLTGPTGAGKSTVAAMFAARGIPVIDADDATRTVQTVGSACVTALSDAFGADILLENGALNRKALAAKAFSSADNTRKLNDITHPFILDEMHRRIDAAKASGAKAAVVDAPLLFEANLDRICDLTVAVISDEAVRKARICARDGLDVAAAEQRMAAQPKPAFYRDRADITVVNDGDVDALAAQIDRIATEATV